MRDTYGLVGFVSWSGCRHGINNLEDEWREFDEEGKESDFRSIPSASCCVDLNGDTGVENLLNGTTYG